MKAHAPSPPRVSRRRRVPWWAIGAVLLGVGALVGAVVIFSTPKFVSDRAPRTRNDLKAIHAVAEAWRANHGNECPTVQRLKDEKELASSTPIVDARGNPFVIRCTDDATFVISSDARFPE